MKKEREYSRDFQGIWIPKEIWLSSDLTMQEKIFLVEIRSLYNNGSCFASNKYFAEFFDLSASRCSQIINSLKDKGFITIEYENGTNGSVIKRFLKVVNMSKGGIENTKGGIENTKRPIEYPKDSNNTYNNTYNIKENPHANLEILNKENYIPTNDETHTSYLYNYWNNTMDDKYRRWWKVKGAYGDRISKLGEKEKDMFIERFNNQCVIDNIAFNERVIFAKLNNYAMSWLSNIKEKKESNSMTAGYRTPGML